MVVIVILGILAEGTRGPSQPAMESDRQAQPSPEHVRAQMKMIMFVIGTPSCLSYERNGIMAPMLCVNCNGMTKASPMRIDRLFSRTLLFGILTWWRSKNAQMSLHRRAPLNARLEVTIEREEWLMMRRRSRLPHARPMSFPAMRVEGGHSRFPFVVVEHRAYTDHYLQCFMRGSDAEAPMIVRRL
jgi:hypothetical protein